jgi:uncharacterized protein
MKGSTRFRLPVTAAGLSLLGLAFLTGVIAYRNFHSVHSMLEPAPRSLALEAPEGPGIGGLETVAFQSPDGIRLEAWYLPSRSGAAVLVAHGTNGDRGSMVDTVRILAGQGYGVLAFDWPGLGNSEGTIRWDGQARRAMVAAIDWLSTRPGVDPQRVGGLGFSMGAYVMTQVAAADARLRAVVLEAPPPDFEDYVVAHCGRWGPLSRQAGRMALHGSGLLDRGTSAVEVIGRIAPRPVLILGGTRDTEIPSALISRLYTAAGHPKSLWIVDGASHGDYSTVAPHAYADRILHFLHAGLLERGPTGSPREVATDDSVP